MTIRNLDQMLEPTSVTLIGASEEPHTVGHTIARNLIEGGFSGPITFVNPKRTTVLGQPCYESIETLREPPCLAIVATPPPTVPGIIAELGRKGTRAAVVITAGLGDNSMRMLEAARPNLLRILGPNGLGLMLPPVGLNGSFSHRAAIPGDLAFLSQSGALLTAVIDWATARSIGFSHIVSLGDMADVDFGDMLDYLSTDTRSRAILLYMEAVTNAPKFVSAARRAARIKPVIVVKSGRHAAGARAPLSHTGRLAGSDAAFDAAFRRTGLLRVKTLPDLYAAAEVLARSPRLNGDRLAIITNGGGAGVLAADELLDYQGTLATLTERTLVQLDEKLPKIWSRSNPVDIIGDAGPDRYTAAVSAVLEDPAVDAILVIQCPTAITSALDNARAVVEVIERARLSKTHEKLVMTNWLGETAARDARSLFASKSIPTFDTPSEAIAGFAQLTRHARATRELIRTPPAMRKGAPHDWSNASREISEALRTGQNVLSAVAAKSLLAYYGVPIAETHVATSPEHVEMCATKVLAEGHACVVKILSAQISHKSDVGGVRLGLETAKAARQAATEMLNRARSTFPSAVIDGFMVEPMIRRPHAQEVIIGMTVDQTFGPMMLFGAGGVAVEVLGDRALALPPLDMLLARQLIEETRISHLLAGYRDRPPVDLEALAAALVNVSELIIRHPEIRELDINPLLVDEHGIIALDARMKIEDETHSPRAPLAIRPYPNRWEKRLAIAALGHIEIRPIKPEDEAAYRDFISKLSEDDIRLRFFTPRRGMPHHMLARYTQIDYAREMAFVAVNAREELLGVVRLTLDPDLIRGEYGVIVRSDLKGNGLGWQLMQHLIDYARSEQIKEITGLVLAENSSMLQMARELGFSIKSLDGDATVREVTLVLA